MPIKVLNLYCGIGGNRKLWEDVDVTAIELDPDIAKIYQDYFRDDKVIVADAHQYLLDHFKEFDFIWSSPPCPTHTRMNVNFAESKDKTRRRTIKYADMKLYQEIILLQTFFKGKYCIENVIPDYTPLIPAKQNGRHLFWTNFNIKTTGKENPQKQIGIIGQKLKKKLAKTKKHSQQEIVNIKVKQPHYGFDLSDISLNGRKDTILRNCVNPETGLMILNCVRNIITKSNVNQLDIFE